MTNPVQKKVEEVRKHFYSIRSSMENTVFPQCDLVKIKLNELIYWYDNFFIPLPENRCKQTTEIFNEPEIDYSKENIEESEEEITIEESCGLAKNEFTREELREKCIEFTKQPGGKTDLMKFLHSLNVANLSEAFEKGQETINKIIEFVCKEK